MLHMHFDLIKQKIECFISLDCLLWPGRRTKTCLHISSIINIRCHKKVSLPSEGDPPDREEKFIKSGEVASSEQVECQNYARVSWIWEALGLLFLVSARRTDRVMKSPKQGRFFNLAWQLVRGIQNQILGRKQTTEAKRQKKTEQMGKLRATPLGKS